MPPPTPPPPHLKSAQAALKSVFQHLPPPASIPSPGSEPAWGKNKDTMTTITKIHRLKTILPVAAFAMFASVSNAATTYNIDGSNTPQSGESTGTIANTFTLEAPVGGGTVNLTTLSDTWSWELNHLTNNQTFTNGTMTDFNYFDVTLDASGDVTSVLFDGDTSFGFLGIQWDSAYINAAGSRNSGADNRFNYSAGVVFLDNVTVSQVSEPSSLALLSLSGLALLRRRRR